MKTAKQDHEIMAILKVKEISRIICDTDMGTLKLRIRKGESSYQFVLDAVELPKELNDELMEAIYPVQKVVVGLDTAYGSSKAVINVTNDFLGKELVKEILKPKGRPKGAKNKVKDNV